MSMNDIIQGKHIHIRKKQKKPGLLKAKEENSDKQYGKLNWI